ncbi:Late Golgi vesicles protein [Mortierella hygrophila]|uniref:Late Golgi vesicles protein n=1 Tax=Mortierella hygrophila TaxID=979708 RepID=A0A9P6K1B8_9FUNG|nr:Late Golgi vesicles protein [Mortierella hygrophila]
MAQGASLFRLLNLITSILIILGGILLFVMLGSWNSGILGVFVVLFGMLTFSLEFAIPESIVYNMGFLFSLLGRGVFYVRQVPYLSSIHASKPMGLLTLSWKWFNILVGCLIMAVGFFYVAMHFVGATPSPSMSAVPNTSSNNLNPGITSGYSYTNPTPQNEEDLQPNMTENYQGQTH